MRTERGRGVASVPFGRPTRVISIPSSILGGLACSISRRDSVLSHLARLLGASLGVTELFHQPVRFRPHRLHSRVGVGGPRITLRRAIFRRDTCPARRGGAVRRLCELRPRGVRVRAGRRSPGLGLDAFGGARGRAFFGVSTLDVRGRGPVLSVG